MATLMSIEWNDMDKALFYKIIRRDKSEWILSDVSLTKGICCRLIENSIYWYMFYF